MCIVSFATSIWSSSATRAKTTGNETTLSLDFFYTSKPTHDDPMVQNFNNGWSLSCLKLQFSMIISMDFSLWFLIIIITKRSDSTNGNKQDSPERPSRGNGTTDEESFNQLWTQSGESCPLGSIPMRRTTKSDVLRANSVRRFGRRLRKPIRRDSSGGGHEVTSSSPLVRIDHAGGIIMFFLCFTLTFVGSIKYFILQKRYKA